MFISKMTCRGFCVRALSLLALASLSPSSMLLDRAWSADSADNFKLMTYNIRYDNPRDGQDVWANRVDAVVDLIARQDVVGLQEVTAGQLKTLVARVPGFEFYGVGRDDGRSRGEHAPIGFRKSRFEALEQGTFWLSTRPTEVGVAGWDASLPRTCTWVLLKDRATGGNLWVANTHFDHRGQTARLESSRLIKRVVMDQPKKSSIVVMGDFNCLQKSPPYLELVDDKLLTDARLLGKEKAVGPSSTWNGFRSIAHGRILDHIFVRGQIEIEQLSTLDPKTSAGRYASDHLPVQVIMNWHKSDVKKN